MLALAGSGIEGGFADVLAFGLGHGGEEAEQDAAGAGGVVDPRQRAGEHLQDQAVGLEVVGQRIEFGGRTRGPGSGCLVALVRTPLTRSPPWLPCPPMMEPLSPTTCSEAAPRWSACPEDPSSYRCDRLVDDVEALREHLCLDRMGPARALRRRNLRRRGCIRPRRATRASLAVFGAPVLLLAGELDLGTSPRLAAEFAELFPNAKLVVQAGGGHFPWLDDADRFTATIEAFLG